MGGSEYGAACGQEAELHLPPGPQAGGGGYRRHRCELRGGVGGGV